MPTHEKRTVSKTVKMTPSDYALFRRAAKVLWPDHSNPSDSSTLCTLARIAAKATLEKKRGKT